MSAYSAVVLADGPVGYWRLGESLFSAAAVDQTGNQNGTYTNSAGVQLAQAGIPGGGGDTSVRFIAASNGSVGVADNATQHVGDIFTLEAWVQRITTGVNDAIYNGGVATSYGLSFNTSDQLEFSKTNTAVIADSTVSVTADNRWHHVVATKNGATVALYVDSVNVTGTVTNATIVDSNGINLAFNSVNSRWFGGYLDEMAIYPTALSATQVLAHYQTGAAQAVLQVLSQLQPLGRRFA